MGLDSAVALARATRGCSQDPRALQQPIRAASLLLGKRQQAGVVTHAAQAVTWAAMGTGDVLRARGTAHGQTGSMAGLKADGITEPQLGRQPSPRLPRGCHSQYRLSAMAHSAAGRAVCGNHAHCSWGRSELNSSKALLTVQPWFAQLSGVSFFGAGD